MGIFLKGCVAALLCGQVLSIQAEDSLRVMFWNLENFFDFRNDTTSVSDAEFSSFGERHWSRKRFYTKCNAIAKGILWAGTEEGGLPDVVGFAEVENAFVLRRLLQATILQKLDYKYVHFDSPDSRGIDVALLYRSSRLRLEDARPCHLFQADTVMATRDILLCRFSGRFGPFSVLVNHHPSKYGGSAVSEPRRRLAVERLRFLADSLATLGETRIIATGDFNDTPANPLYKLLEPTLLPLSEALHRQGKGSIKYDGKWDLIDQFYVSPALLPAAMEILYIPFLQVPDAAHGGTKPLRTYSGPRYLGGVSDHCPIWLTIPFPP